MNRELVIIKEGESAIEEISTATKELIRVSFICNTLPWVIIRFFCLKYLILFKK